MLFDEIKIDSTNIDGELYVNVEQLRSHLLGSAQLFAEETVELSKTVKIIKEEKYFVMGMVEGMMSVVAMLSLAHEESAFDEVETVEDLLQRFKENDES